VTLAIIQGVTEFLPISSSGHLVLVPAITGWPDQGASMDVAVHVGTLGAVLLYFRYDVGRLFSGAWQIVTRRRSAETRLVWFVVVATVPLVIVGLVLHQTGAYDSLRSAKVIAWTMLGFGIVLYAADRWGRFDLSMETMSARHAVLIGLAQAIALIPGTSRSGICITAARWLGFNRTEAARFAMVLSIPAIVAAGTLATLEIVKSGDTVLTGDALIAAAIAFATALAAIAIMMRWLENASYMPFIVYRLALGVILLVWAYGWI
jgi:undecaprenyl-diphosphatase